MSFAVKITIIYACLKLKPSIRLLSLLRFGQKTSTHNDSNAPVPLIPHNDIQISDEVVLREETTRHIETTVVDAVFGFEN